jgi:hypothetical protein
MRRRDLAIGLSGVDRPLMTHVIASHYNISQLVPLLRQADHKALIAWERYMHETERAV